jgi:hypothetical protein
MPEQEPKFTIEEFKKEEDTEIQGLDVPEAGQEQEIEKEIENLPQNKREKLGLGINNIGFFIEAKKDAAFARIHERAILCAFLRCCGHDCSPRCKGLWGGEY